jgi:hypothetical protein
MLEVVRCFREKADIEEPPLFAQRGSLQVAFVPNESDPRILLPWHEPLPLSKAACTSGWRFMEKLFSG